ncbi:MAG: response regulator [Candidatus Poribacteria bacterium]|nr:response regulator [Candidatus Poribacteria bacterium]
MNIAVIRILLVEDNAADARIIREHLVEADGPPADVIHVERAREAVEYLERNRVDVVLLDLLLPDCSGAETVATVYAAAPTVPIIVMSGLEDESTIARAVEEGAQDYLIKTHVNAYLLMHSIRFAMERQRIMNERFLSISDVAKTLNAERIVELERKVERLITLLQQRGALS